MQFTEVNNKYGGCLGMCKEAQNVYIEICKKLETGATVRTWKSRDYKWYIFSSKTNNAFRTELLEFSESQLCNSMRDQPIVIRLIGDDNHKII